MPYRKPFERQKRYQTLIRRKKYCHFCKHEILVDFSDLETLKRYITGYGKIQARKRTGACTKHQKKIKKAIKKARFLGLLSYTKH